MALLNYEIVEQIGLTLLHFVWQGLLIGLLFWLALLATRTASAQTRYNMAVGTLLLLAVTPVLTFVYLNGGSNQAPSLANPEQAALMSLIVNATSEGQAPTLLAWTVAGWLAGVILLSARLVMGWHYIGKLRRSANYEPLVRFKPVLDGLRATMAVGKSVGLAASERISSPVVIGWIKPLILFPPALLTRLDPAQIEMILAHELAHIRRHDHLVNLFQTVIETLLFYHPMVALVSRQIRIERENACDDLAVSSTQNRLAYVEMLATLEHLRQPGNRLALGMHDGQIVGRIRRLVEGSRTRRQLGVTLPVVVGILLAASTIATWLMPPQDNNAAASSTFEQLPDSALSSVQTPSEAVAQAPAQTVVESPSETSSRSAASEIETSATDDFAGELLENSDAESASDTSSVIAPSPSGSEVNSDSEVTLQPPSTSASRSEATEAPEASSVIEPAEINAPTSQADSVQQSVLEPNAIELAMRPATAPALVEDAAASIPVAIEPPPLSGGQLIRELQPDFPRSALRRGINGTVELAFTVDRRGQVQGVSIIEESPAGWRFGEAAVEAIEQWRFEPYRRGTESVDRQVRLEIEFDPADVCRVTTGSRLPRCLSFD